MAGLFFYECFSTRPDGTDAFCRQSTEPPRAYALAGSPRDCFPARVTVPLGRTKSLFVGPSRHRDPVLLYTERN
jgi:hypothetical protein